MRAAPQFTASPAPSEQEAAAIAATLALVLEQEAIASAASAASARLIEDDQGVSAWVAHGRAHRAVPDYRHTVKPAWAWRLSAEG